MTLSHGLSPVSLQGFGSEGDLSISQEKIHKIGKRRQVSGDGFALQLC